MVLNRHNWNYMGCIFHNLAGNEYPEKIMVNQWTNFPLLSYQVISWNQSPSVLIQGNIETTDLKYPAVTLCPKVTTRWGIAERLGNYIDPLKLPKELLLLRHNSFMCATGFLKKISQHDTSKEAFKSDCIPKYSIGESSDSCKVIKNVK